MVLSHVLRYAVHVQKGCAEIMQGSHAMEILRILADARSRTPEQVFLHKERICTEELGLW